MQYANPIGSRQELYINRHLIEQLDGPRLMLDHLQPREVVVAFESIVGG